MKEQMEALRQRFESELQAAQNSEAVEKLRVAYLGKKGSVTELLKGLKSVAGDQKKEMGQLINQLKRQVEEGIAQQVEKIRREGDTQRVTVGYLSQYNEDGSLILNTSEITPVKYYDYIFTRNDGNYYLSAIVSSDMTASSSSEETDSADSVPNAQDQLMEQLAPETDSQVTSASAAE